MAEVQVNNLWQTTEGGLLVVTFVHPDGWVSIQDFHCSLQTLTRVSPNSPALFHRLIEKVFDRTKVKSIFYRDNGTRRKEKVIKPRRSML